MSPIVSKPRLKERPELANNTAKLMTFAIAEGMIIAAGIGVLLEMGVSDTWWIVWVMLALFAGSFVGSYLLFPGKTASQPIRQRSKPTQAAGEYDVVSIVQLLVDGFTPDGLRQLVRNNPTLQAMENEVGLEGSPADIADTIVWWVSTHGKVGELLTAAARANPRMYAVHRPYHPQDREQPVQTCGDAMRDPFGYNLANIRRLLVQGFSVDELHRLVRYDPALGGMDETFRPGDDVGEMVDTIFDWGQRLLIFDRVLAAAERANPRRYAAHRPYHAQDQEQPTTIKAYDLSRIAALLEEVFESASLYQFCRERATLGAMWMEISIEDNLARMIYRVLAYAERQVLLDDFLMEVQAAYPEAYERFKPYEKGALEPANEQATE